LFGQSESNWRSEHCLSHGAVYLVEGPFSTKFTAPCEGGCSDPRLGFDCSNQRSLGRAIILARGQLSSRHWRVEVASQERWWKPGPRIKSTWNADQNLERLVPPASSMRRRMGSKDGTSGRALFYAAGEQLNATKTASTTFSPDRGPLKEGEGVGWKWRSKRLRGRDSLDSYKILSGTVRSRGSADT